MCNTFFVGFLLNKKGLIAVFHLFYCSYFLCNLVEKTPVKEVASKVVLKPMPNELLWHPDYFF